MKELFTRSLVKAMVIGVACVLVIAGVVQAQENLWSADVVITIETPTGDPHLVITEVEVNRGTYDEDTGVWTLSIPRGGTARIFVHLRNDGGDAIRVDGAVEGEATYWPVDGVVISTHSLILAAGESGILFFTVQTEADVEPGTLPSIRLELKG